MAMLAFFNETVRQGWYKKSFLTQYLKWGSHKKDLLVENDSRDMYVGISFNLICYVGLA